MFQEDLEFMDKISILHRRNNIEINTVFNTKLDILPMGTGDAS
jgi:hypothetical protein